MEMIPTFCEFKADDSKEREKRGTLCVQVKGK
jgi:hypothetical protein